MTTRDLSAVVRHYLICALWSSTDATGEPLDDEFDLSDVSTEFYKQATDDCEAFIAETDHIDSSWWTDEQFGHDFWLTRNHHGAGFWDRGQGEAGRQLTACAHTHGDCYPYIGEDGEIYAD